MEYSKHSIRTFTGKHFDFTVMDPETIDIRDIAHALSGIPRYTAHTPETYSVGQHSIMACLAAPDECKIEALLHDAAEAYLGDVSKPLKTLLPDYQALETNLEAVLSEKYQLDYTAHGDYVKFIDNELLQSELKTVFSGISAPWAWPREKVESVFLGLYRRYSRTEVWHGRLDTGFFMPKSAWTEEE
jgi:uncharacterized protein